MLLEVREVSRKTPADGRLEISAEIARRLAACPPPLQVKVDETRAGAELVQFDCQCGKGGEGGHRHHFLSSPLLRTLRTGESIALELEGSVVAVARPHPLRPP